MFEYCRTAATMGRSAASVASFQRPRSAGRDAAVGLDRGRLDDQQPAPESARLPRWIMCQSVAQPSSAEYWHIGEMTMRLGSVMVRRVSGEKRALTKTVSGMGWDADCRTGAAWWVDDTLRCGMTAVAKRAVEQPCSWMAKPLETIVGADLREGFN